MTYVYACMIQNVPWTELRLSAHNGHGLTTIERESWSWPKSRLPWRNDHRTYIYISIYKMFDHGTHVWSCMFNLHGFMCHTCTGLWFGEWVLGGSTADVPGMETAHPWQYPSFPPRQGPGSIPKSGWMSSFMFLCYKWQSKLTESHSANPLDAELLLVSI